MGRRFFLTSTTRDWHNMRRIKARHEFDVSYQKNVTYRLKNKKENNFDYILEHSDCKTITKDVLLQKLSEISSLPEPVIHCVLLDFFDLISLSLLNEKTISLHSFGSLSKVNGKIVFRPSKQLVEDTCHFDER